MLGLIAGAVVMFSLVGMVTTGNNAFLASGLTGSCVWFADFYRRKYSR